MLPWSSATGVAAGRICVTVAMVASLTACQRSISPEVASGAAAYQAFPAVDPDVPMEEYRIGAFDSLDVTVYGEPELALRAARVDAAGLLSMPLIGQVQASGRTTAELSNEIARRLGQRYLEDPQVNVLVATAVSQRVTVDGSVNSAGVFPIQGRATLLEAIALAGGTARVAKLDEVVVFRMIDGKQNAGVFNVDEIRRGIAPNPTIYGNDVVVVGVSNVKAAWRDILTASPFVNVFRPLL